MITLGDLFLALRADDSKLKGDLDKAERDSKSWAGRAADGIKGAIGTGLAAIGGLAVAGIGAGVAALATTIGPASDLNETLSKVGVVFGEQADEVIRFGENAAQAMGMSQNAALSAAGTYGNLFRSMGIVESASADMSMGLVTLAGDLASFNNMAPEEVLDKLRAGLTGETEPLKALGVNLNAAMVEAKALELGLVGVDEEMTAAAKAQATYALILEQTTLAQGDFERTSDGLANQQRILAAEFENIQAQIGTALLPVVTQAAQMFNQWLSDPEVQAGLQTLVTWIGTNLPIAIDTLSKFWREQLQPALEKVWGFLQTNVVPILQTVWNWLSVNLPPAIKALSDFWTTTLYPAIQKVWGFIDKNLVPLFKALVDLYIANIAASLRLWAEIWEEILWPALQKVGNWIEVHLGPVFEKFTTWLADATGGVEGIEKAISGVIGWIQNLTSSLQNISLPDWLTPGSPTPFEMGLRGISDAMRELADEELVRLTARLGTLGINGRVGASESGVTTNNAFTVNFNGGASRGNGARAVNTMKAMARSY